MSLRGQPLVVIEDIPLGLGPSSREHSVSSGSRTTVLSARSYDFNNLGSDEMDENEETFPYVALEMEWEALQKRCSHRDMLLRRMAKTKSPEFMKILKKRELKVRRQEFRKLFLRHLRNESLLTREDLKNDDESVSEHQRRKRRIHQPLADDDDTSSEIWFDTSSESVHRFSVDPSVCSSDTSYSRGRDWSSKARELALFEWHTTAPAIMSLVVHCFGHAALYDGIEVLSEEFKKYCGFYGLQRWPIRPEFVALFIMFILGITLLRMSGFLYWWLNENDFLCLKFDYHNRSRLDWWDARFLLWMRRHPVCQALSYFAGYQLIFMVVNEIFYYSFYLFDQRQTILESLPSERFFKDQGRFPASSADTRQSSESNTCSEELVVLTDETTALLSQDIRYLWKKLIVSSFDAFCYDWVTDLAGEDEHPRPLVTPFRAVSVCIITIAFCVVILKHYGFGVFEKY